MSTDGSIFSHSAVNDNCKKRGSVTLKKNDTVTVELDPSTGRVTFNLLSSEPIELSTNISASNTNPVNFCVVLRSKTDNISII